MTPGPSTPRTLLDIPNVYRQAGEILYEAVRSPFGVVVAIRMPGPTAKDYLKQAKRRLEDPTLNNLVFRIIDPETIWVIKKRKGTEGPPDDPESGLHYSEYPLP